MSFNPNAVSTIVPAFPLTSIQITEVPVTTGYGLPKGDHITGECANPNCDEEYGMIVALDSTVLWLEKSCLCAITREQIEAAMDAFYNPADNSDYGHYGEVDARIDATDNFSD